MIQPDLVADVPGIELESDSGGPAVQVRNEKPNIAGRVSAARINAGLDDEAEPNTETRGVVNAPDTREGLDNDTDP